MKSLPYWQVDAFVLKHTSKLFSGNPAAVMPLDAFLPDAVMQSIAAEHNLAETAFFAPNTRGTADFDLRWFTPTVEAPLCGHATLASAHVLFELLRFAGDVVRFRINSGAILSVERHAHGLALSMPVIQLGDVMVPPDSLRSALGAMPTALYSDPSADSYPLALFDRQWDVASLSPDYTALTKLYPQIIATAPGDDCDFVSRFFAPGFGINEDPVTGSSHARLVPFWSKRLDKAVLSARQISPRGGDLDCVLDGDTVTLTGTCQTVAAGQFYLPE